MTKKSSAQLETDLTAAKQLVEIGATYYHYKSHDNLYTVIDLAIQEADTEVCVIYRAEYANGLLFTRPLSSWLNTIEVNGEPMQRFTKI